LRSFEDGLARRGGGVLRATRKRKEDAVSRRGERSLTNGAFQEKRRKRVARNSVDGNAREILKERKKTRKGVFMHDGEEKRLQLWIRGTGKRGGCQGIFEAASPDGERGK